MSRSASLARQLQAQARYVQDLAAQAARDGDAESFLLLQAHGEDLLQESGNLLARATARRTLSLQQQHEGILS